MSFSLDRFDCCKTKFKISTVTYKMFGKLITSNAIIISGPNIEKHLDYSMNIIKGKKKGKLFLVEKDPIVFEEMKRRFKLVRHPVKDRTELVNCDIRSFEPGVIVRFEDLDLCRTIKNLKYLIGDRLQRQTKLKSKLNKGFVVTLSLRRCGFDYTLNHLNRLFEDILGYRFILSRKIRVLKNCFIHEYHWTKTLKQRYQIKEVIAFNYSEYGLPMFQFGIIYRSE